MYLSIVAWTPENRVWKHQVFDTLIEAETHAASVAVAFPNAFACSHPGQGDTPYWVADPIVKTVTYDAVRDQANNNSKSMAALRSGRQAKLDECDWTQNADSPLDAATKRCWANYRQALRDLPAITKYPEYPTWPIKPSGQ